MQLTSFKHDDWVKIWEGQWSLLTCCNFIQQYTQIKFGGKPFQSQSIVSAAWGRSAAWMRQKDRDRVGNCLSRRVSASPRLVNQMASNLKGEAKDLLKFIDRHEGTICTWELYQEFWHRVLAYYPAHMSVKYVVDYLDADLLKRHLPLLQEARLAAESVFNRTEDFMISFAKLLSRETGHQANLLLCLTNDELKYYFIRGKIPAKTELQQRYRAAALLRQGNRQELLAGVKVKLVERIVNPRIRASELKGSIAFRGKVFGVARIVNDPGKVRLFNKGDILVTGMTRPDFLPLIRRAGAVVTDAGGILSHAAIVSRELGIPCVIGTKIATKVLKDGYLVEVDANKGIVRKL